MRQLDKWTRLKTPRIAVVGLSGQSIIMHVDHFNQPGETIVAHQLHVEPGGKGYNQAYACCKLGAFVALLSAIGADEYGTSCINQFEEMGGIGYFIAKEEKTALATVLVDKFGNNQVAVFHGAATQLSTDDVVLFEDEIKMSDIVLLQLEVPIEVTKKVMALGTFYNKKIILNPAPAHQYDKAVLEKAWLLTPNEMEAKTIFGIKATASREQLIAAILSSAYQRVIVTLGADGSVLIENKKATFINPIKQVAIDSTGAGDAFNAMLAVALGKGFSLKEAAAYANIASSKSVTKQYVLASMPTTEEIIINKVQKV